MAAYLNQNFILPVFTQSSTWLSRIIIFGSIVGAFYLTQSWIEVDFRGNGSFKSEPGTGYH